MTAGGSASGDAPPPAVRAPSVPAVSVVAVEVAAAAATGAKGEVGKIHGEAAPARCDDGARPGACSQAGTTQRPASRRRCGQWRHCFRTGVTKQRSTFSVSTGVAGAADDVPPRSAILLLPEPAARCLDGFPPRGGPRILSLTLSTPRRHSAFQHSEEGGAAKSSVCAGDALWLQAGKRATTRAETFSRRRCGHVTVALVTHE